MVACGSGQQCMIMYSNTNYGGGQFRLVDTSSNGCVHQQFLGQQVRSYDNRGSAMEGYFYSGGSCDGTMIRAVTHGSRSSNIGGIAYSFRAACVACRSEG